MGLAVAMVLFLLALAVVLFVVVSAAQGVAHVTHLAYVALRGARHRGHS